MIGCVKKKWVWLSDMGQMTKNHSFPNIALPSQPEGPDEFPGKGEQLESAGVPRRVLLFGFCLSVAQLLPGRERTSR